MPYLSISDFKIGMDQRRPQTVGVPGSLWTLKNAVVSRGGDIIRAKKFDADFELPAGTFGLYALKSQLWVFGSSGTPVDLPAQIQYQRLNPGGNMTAVLDVKAFDGKLYVIAEFDTGSIYHFYDGVRVTSWNTLAAPTKADVVRHLARKVGVLAAVSAQAIGNDLLVTAAVPGTAFSISASLVDANVDVHGETPATGTVVIAGVLGNGIDDVTINGTSLLANPPYDVVIAWFSSNDATAGLLRDAINGGTSDHGYTATAAAATVTITAPAGTGATQNGYTVVGAGSAVASDTDMAGGIDATVLPALAVTTVRANVAAVAEVRATGSVEITGGTAAPGVNRVHDVLVDAVSLMGHPIDWTTSNTATALLVANEINNGTATHGYSASVAGPIITLTAEPGTGSASNGDAVSVNTDGSVTVLLASIAGGVDEVAAVAQISKVAYTGDITRQDTFTVTIDGSAQKTTGLAAVMGTTVLVHKRRLWSLVGSLLRYCKLGDPTNWSTTTPAPTGAGFINIASESDGAQDLLALGVYQGNLAIFAREEIIIYSISTDAEENAYVETVGNTGTFAPRSVIAFGNSDLFYLDESGVRSVRARQGTNAAYKADIGEAIDPFIQDVIAEATELAVERAQGVIESRDGRFMLTIGRIILVYSYYPDSKIFAWSFINFEDDIDEIVRSSRDVFIRASDFIYRYGGSSGVVYPDADEFEAIALTPFMDAKDPATQKLLEGFDMACAGEWLVEALVDPNNFDAVVEIGRISRFTYSIPKITLPGHTSHFAFRFTCSSAGYASLSSMAIGYQKGKAA